MPRYEVTYKNKDMDDNVDVDVHGVGRIANGGSRVVDLSDEQADAIRDSENSFLKLKQVKADRPTTMEEEQAAQAQEVADLPATGEEAVEAQEEAEGGEQ